MTDVFKQLTRTQWSHVKILNCVCAADPDLNPMPTEELVQMFNELRSDLVLLYELKQAHSNCEYEQQMLRHRYEALLKAGGGGGCGGIVGSAQHGVEPNAANSTAVSTPGGDAQVWPGPDDIKVEAKEQIIDVVGAPLTPNSVRLLSARQSDRRRLIQRSLAFILRL